MTDLRPDTPGLSGSASRSETRRLPSRHLLDDPGAPGKASVRRLCLLCLMSLPPDRLVLHVACREPWLTRRVTAWSKGGARYRESVKRGSIAGPATRRGVHKIYCSRGHPYAGSNLIITMAGKRLCRVCHNWHRRVSRARKGGEMRETRTEIQSKA